MITFTNGTKAERTREITDFAWCSSRKMDAVGKTKIWKPREGASALLGQSSSEPAARSMRGRSY